MANLKKSRVMSLVRKKLIMPIGIAKILKETRIGHGENSTKWKGWRNIII